MKKMQFVKYSATGNDFVLIDDRDHQLTNDPKFWSKICKRRIGIGADGVILVRSSTKATVKMDYFNADGEMVEMCGNGMRAITHFISTYLKLNSNDLLFSIESINSVYQTKFGEEISVLMAERYDENRINLSDFSIGKKSFYINTGVPHAVFLVQDLNAIDCKNLGQKIRYDKRFVRGTNANFVQITNNSECLIKTYERGVEDLTLSCGTGVCAAFYALNFWQLTNKEKYIFQTDGGKLIVQKKENRVELSGKVEVIYEGNFTF